jgi:CheY-like chemotaxis protein
MPYTLLLADDSITIQRVIELTFADEDIKVLVAGDGRKAIERIQSDHPDIVLADIGMPDRNGYDVAAFVKGDPALASIPVVLLTGAFEPLDEERARRVGCDGVLVKPFEPQLVIARVKELLAHRHRPTVHGAPAAAPHAVSTPPSSGVQGRSSHDLESMLIPPPAPDKAAADALEDYFDRLDAAFANIGAAQPPRPKLETDDLTAIVSDLQQIAQEPPPQTGGDPLTSWDPDIVADFGPARQPHLANAFAALLAAEEGHAAPSAAVTLAPPPTAITDELVDQIVERVIARMGDESMRRLVVDTAERLVREEIDRIKKTAGI